MSKRSSFVVFLLTSSILVVVSWFVILARSSPICLARYKSIKNGMAKASVYELLGQPSENRENLIPPQAGTGPPPDPYESELPQSPKEMLEATWDNWIADSGTVIVLFNKDTSNWQGIHISATTTGISGFDSGFAVIMIPVDVQGQR
jgi:hypothetical protein